MLTKRTTAALSVALVLAVGACSGDNTGASPAASAGGASAPAGSPAASEAASGGAPSAAADISGTLQIDAKYGCKPIPCTPGEGGADEIGTTRVDIFAEQYPDVELEFTEKDFDPATFLTSVASGNPPDVVRIGRDILGTYVAEGALEPLNDCISRFGIDMSQYREPAVAAVTTAEGEIYGIPEFYDSRILLINDSVVEDAGLTTADVDTADWDKLKTVSKAMSKTEDGKLTRIGFDPKLPEFLPLWAKANGASIISDDGKTSQLDDPKVAEALEYAVSLVSDQAPGPEFTDFKTNGPGGKDFFGPDNQFAADTLGTMPMEQWYLNVLANNTPDEKISFAPFKDRQGNTISLSGGSALAIPASAKNKDAACEYIRVLTLPETWYAAAKVRADKRAADGEAFTGVYSGNKLADEMIFGELVNEQTAGAYYPGVQLVLETADTAFSLPPNAAAEEFTRIWQGAVQKVLNDGADAAETLTQADQEAQNAIDAAQQ
jgi:multiple sugar transport system substrate-binding protein